MCGFFFFNIFKFIYFYRGGRREKERERNINMWLPLMNLPLRTWPTTQAHSLTGNQTGNPLVHRLALNPLSHTSQGRMWVLSEKCMEFQKFLLPTQSLLVFAARICGDLSSWQCNPGLGGLVWGWGSLIPRYPS